MIEEEKEYVEAVARLGRAADTLKRSVEMASPWCLIEGSYLLVKQAGEAAVAAFAALEQAHDARPQ